MTAKKRTRRISLVVEAATADGVDALASLQGISVNELVTGILAEVCSRNSGAIAEYNAAKVNLREKYADSISLLPDTDK